MPAYKASLLAGALALATAAPAFGQGDREAKVDCFYVGQEPLGAISAEFARLPAVCQAYAPLTGPAPLPTDGELAYQATRAAWARYMKHDNEGRPVVLIGHGQGAIALKRLMAEEIDGRNAQDFMVSAVLLGAEVNVPPGKDAGGDFRSIPLCRAKAQTGCVIADAAAASGLVDTLAVQSAAFVSGGDEEDNEE